MAVLPPLPTNEEALTDTNRKTTPKWRAWLQGIAQTLSETGATISAIFTTAHTWTAAQTFSVSPIISALIDLTSGQIKFPATQVPSADPNTLDDYEEGTFTPTIAFGGNSVGVTYSAQTGAYTKIGNRVFVNITMTLTSRGSSTGNATIQTLPFTPASAVAAYAWFGNFTIGAGLQPLFDTSSTTIRIRSFNPTTGNENSVAETTIDNDFSLKLTLSFTV